jgi:2-aminoethylphosphonate-pyruvate transaminase
MAYPVFSFVIGSRKALAAGHARTVYLDLAGYAAEQDRGGTPFAQSVQCCYALDEALDEFAEEGGWGNRQRRYRSRMQIVRDGLTKLAIVPLLEVGASFLCIECLQIAGGDDLCGAARRACEYHVPHCSHG